MGRIQQASRARARARIAIDGPSGAGKTLTGLRFAMALGDRVGVIDTERGSASLYVGMEFDGKPIQFLVKELATFSPAEYTAAIAEFAAERVDVLVIDSLSHAWEGVDGALEMVSAKEGNSYFAWKDVTPLHRRMVDSFLNFPGHVICTMRSKTAYTTEKNEKGKEVPRRIGMAPIQRPGMEYEFTLYVSLDDDHFVRVTKTRCPGLDGATGHKPGAAWLAPFIAFLGTGEVSPPAGNVIPMASDAQVSSLGQLVVELELTQRLFRAELSRRFSVEHLHQLTAAQADSMLAVLRGRLADKQKSSPTGKAADLQHVSAASGHTEAGGEGETLPEAMSREKSADDAARAPTPPAGMATQDQLAALVAVREAYFGMIGWGEAEKFKAERKDCWLKILAKYGVDSATKLPAATCQELNDKLQAKVAALTTQHQIDAAASRAKETTPPAVKPAEPPY